MVWQFIDLKGEALDEQSMIEIKEYIDSMLDYVTFDNNKKYFPEVKIYQDELSDSDKWFLSCHIYFDKLSEYKIFISMIGSWFQEYEFTNRERFKINVNEDSTQWSDSPKPDVMTVLFDTEE